MQDSSLKSRHCRTLKTITDSRTLKVLKMRMRRKMTRTKRVAVKMAARTTSQRRRMKSRLLL